MSDSSPGAPESTSWAAVARRGLTQAVSLVQRVTLRPALRWPTRPRSTHTLTTSASPLTTSPSPAPLTSISSELQGTIICPPAINPDQEMCMAIT